MTDTPSTDPVVLAERLTGEPTATLYLAQHESGSGSTLDALHDALSGWHYIRTRHGDLEGVGWQRVEGKLIAAIRSALLPSPDFARGVEDEKRRRLFAALTEAQELAEERGQLELLALIEEAGAAYNELSRPALAPPLPVAPPAAAVLPEGWVMVPKSPTPEMLGAWYRYKNGHRFPGEEPARDTSDYGAYAAMLAAAPPSDEGPQK